jgi:hypothetical protein
MSITTPRDGSCDDDRRNALWLGASVSLRLDILRPTHRTDQLPTA